VRVEEIVISYKFWVLGYDKKKIIVLGYKKERDNYKL
jgi:hypothetical protein